MNHKKELLWSLWVDNLYRKRFRLLGLLELLGLLGFWVATSNPKALNPPEPSSKKPETLDPQAIS